MTENSEGEEEGQARENEKRVFTVMGPPQAQTKEKVCTMYLLSTKLPYHITHLLFLLQIPQSQNVKWHFNLMGSDLTDIFIVCILSKQK